MNVRDGLTWLFPVLQAYVVEAIIDGAEFFRDFLRSHEQIQDFDFGQICKLGHNFLRAH